MLIAGEPSGDMLAAELVQAIRLELAEAEPVATTDYQPLQTSLEPRFFGAGGPRMAAAGVQLAFDLTEHSVIGLWDALKNYTTFRRLFCQQCRLALEREPDAIICVDFSGFNRRFARAIKRYVVSRADWFHDWAPKLIQYVSPQVWASRESRAYQIARDYDLLLSIIPFEKEWYQKRVPKLRVQFVGHPIVDRYAAVQLEFSNVVQKPSFARAHEPKVVLLPGSRSDELKRHLPVMVGAFGIMRQSISNLRGVLLLPNSTLVEQAKSYALPAELDFRVGGLAEALLAADLAIASTGTVTLECAYFGVPTVAIYKASWSTYEIAKRIIKVKHLAMPNLLAHEELFPELIQHAATAQNIARAALELLHDAARRQRIKAKLAEVVACLGPPGASRRAAQAILRLLEPMHFAPGPADLERSSV